MTAHVAERGEGRGRVVLRLSGTQVVNDHAIRAAIQIAKAFHSEIESLFVYDRQIFDAAGYSFVREIRGSAHRRRVGGREGRQSSALSGQASIDVASIARQIELTARQQQRRVGELALQAEVPVHGRVVHDTPLRALAAACQMSGPWNVVALAEPFTADSLTRLDMLFERVTGMTGVVLVGPRAADVQGPIVAVIEEADRITSMLRTAERLAQASGSEVVLAVAAPTSAAQTWLKSEVIHAVASVRRAVTVELSRAGGGTAVHAEALRQLKPGFVIVKHGGLVLPASGDLRPLGAALSCPMLVVR